MDYMTAIYAFLMGLAFVGGVIVGAWILSSTAKKAVVASNNAFREHSQRVEDRLDGYVKNTDDIAESLRVIAKRTPA
jgi:hypothetical protein